MNKKTFFLIIVAICIFIVSVLGYENADVDVIPKVKENIVKAKLNRGNNVRVAIIDSGISSNINADFVNFSSDEDGNDFFNHGTSIYQFIHAIAPNAEIVNLKVVNKCGITTMKSLEKALRWCYLNDIDVINISMSYSYDDENVYAELSSLIDDGVIVISSINNKDTACDYPSCYKGVISVGNSENHSFIEHSMSIIFNRTFDVDISTIDEDSQSYQGNSFLTSIVTGVAACIISTDNEGVDSNVLVNQLKELLNPLTL